MKSRKEQIEFAYIKVWSPGYASTYREKRAFISGAEWADANPIDKEKLDDVRRVLNRLSILQSGSMDYTTDFYELVKAEIRGLIRRLQ